MLRFSTDVVLIILYGAALIFYKQFILVSLLLVIIFILYCLWGLLRMLEYGMFDQDRKVGATLAYEMSPLPFAVGTGLTIYLYSYSGIFPMTPWVLLVWEYLAIFGFRVAKPTLIRYMGSQVYG